MTAAQVRRTRELARATIIVTLAAGTALAVGCALTHKRAPATQELALDYAPPTLPGLHAVDAAVKVRRFSGLSPYDSTTMYFQPSGYQMESFNYYRWVVSPANQVTDFLYRDLAASHVFRDVFPYLSSEQTRFQLEGTVVEFVMREQDGSWRAQLVINISLIDSQVERSDQRVVLQREFKATRALQHNSADQYAAGMSQAMKSASGDIIRAVHDAAADRVADDETAAAPSS